MNDLKCTPIPIIVNSAQLIIGQSGRKNGVSRSAKILKNSSIAAYDLYARTARCKFIGQSTFQVDLEWFVHWPMAPENFDCDATTDRLDPTWKAQVDSSRLTRPDSQVYGRSDLYQLTDIVDGLYACMLESWKSVQKDAWRTQQQLAHVICRSILYIVL